MELVVKEHSIKTTDDGFIIHKTDWNKDVGKQIALLHQITLEQAHWDIIFFIQEYYQQYKHLPNTRVFIKAIKKKLGEDKGNSRYLHRLFPQGPLKYACKIAGLPKPPTCL